MVGVVEAILVPFVMGLCWCNVKTDISSSAPLASVTEDKDDSVEKKQGLWLLIREHGEELLDKCR